MARKKAEELTVTDLIAAAGQEISRLKTLLAESLEEIDRILVREWHMELEKNAEIERRNKQLVDCRDALLSYDRGQNNPYWELWKEGKEEEGNSFVTHAFLDGWHFIQRAVHQTALDKGWYSDGERNLGELLALCHAELSEALEALRHGNPPAEHIEGFSGVEEELADVVIRLMDMAAYQGYRVGDAIIAKMEFNRTRSERHGGKRF